MSQAHTHCQTPAAGDPDPDGRRPALRSPRLQCARDVSPTAHGLLRNHLRAKIRVYSGRMEGWHRCLGAATTAARTSEQTARFLTAAVLYEDFRYRPSSNRNPLMRSAHAPLSLRRQIGQWPQPDRILEFRSRRGRWIYSDLYMPAGYNTASRAEIRMALAFGGFAAQVWLASSRRSCSRFRPNSTSLSRASQFPIGGCAGNNCPHCAAPSEAV